MAFRRKAKELMVFLRDSEAAFLLFFAIVVGLGAGFGAIFFRGLIGSFRSGFFDGGGRLLSFLGPYYVVLLPAFGGLIIGPLIYLFSRETKGHGVPEVILAVATAGGRIRPRVAAVKALVSSICIGSGGSAGREGPIVQIGSAMGSSLAQWFRLSGEKTKVLVACGAAGGIAATFNAPLAGIFFALEVILGNYALRFFSAVVLSSVMSTVVCRHFLGDSPAFRVPEYQLGTVWELPLYTAFGFLAGLTAILFIKSLYKSEDLFDSLKIPDYLKPALGGLLVGLIGLQFPQVFGVGYEPIEAALYGSLAAKTVMILVLLKILATSATLGSGGSGGVFAPSLFIGAMLGEAYGKLAQFLVPTIAFPPGSCALVGMGAVFAGAAHAPISAILILFEMTGNYKILLPLMITCVISTVVARWLMGESIYTFKLKRRGVDVQRIRGLESFVGLLESISVREVYRRDPPVPLVPDTMPIDEVLHLATETQHVCFPVVNTDGEMTGLILLDDLRAAFLEPDLFPLIIARDIALTSYEPVRLDDDLGSALRKLLDANTTELPVVAASEPCAVVGTLNRHDLILAYHRQMREHLTRRDRDRR